MFNSSPAPHRAQSQPSTPPLREVTAPAGCISFTAEQVAKLDAAFLPYQEAKDAGDDYAAAVALLAYQRVRANEHTAAWVRYFRGAK